MADLASLKIAVDSRDTVKAAGNLETMSASAGRSSAAVDKLTASNNRLAAAMATSNKPIIDATRYINNMERELAMVGKSALQVKALEIRMAAAAAPTAELAREIRQVGAELIRAERNAQSAGGAMGRLTGASNMQRMGFQQLGYQIGDMSTMFALGAKPTQIFASQIGQITQAVQLAAGGTSRFAAFLGGPWGIALTVAVMALGPLIGMLFEADDTATKATGSLDRLSDQFDATALSADQLAEANARLAESNREVERTALQALAAQRRTVDAQIVQETAELQRNVLRLGRLRADALAGGMEPAEVQAYQREIRSTSNAIVAQTAAIAELRKASNTAAFDATRLTAGMNEQEAQVASLTATINELREVYRNTQDPDALVRMISLEQQLQAIQDTSSNSTRRRRTAMSEEERAARDQERRTLAFIEALREETATIGMNEYQLRQHEIAQALSAATTREQLEDIIRLNQAREEALRIQAEEDAAEERRKRLEQNTQDVRDAIAAQEAYNAMIGMSGEKLRLAQIEEQRRVKALELTRDELEELIPMWNEYYDLQVEAANQETILEKEARKAEELRKQLQGVLATLDDILGTNGAIGNLFNRLEEDFPDFFKKMQKGFEGIAKQFGIDLGKAMDGFMMGAEMGKMFAGLSKAVGLPSSKTGGQIGGAIGGAVGGPLGAAIGSAVGSLSVGLAKGVKKASATIEVLASDQVQQTVKGNKALQDAATGMANSLIDGLKQVADALGGSLLEGVKISIGQRGNTFRVDPLGLGRTKGMEKFKTEEEAIAYAMKLALEKGVIQGISESAQRLLAAGNELQDAIEKAVLFEGVFDRLKEKLDPVGYSLEKLDKEFAKLRAVFKEAGASAAEYASLEQLYALERAAVLKDANKEQIDELQQTVDSMKDLSDSLREFRDSLFRANSGVVNYQSALVDLIRVGALAASGDAAALGQLQGVSETFLGASRSRARSLFEYQRDAALVANYVDQGIAAADAQVSAAQQQIDLLGSQLDQLEQINAKMGAPAVASGSPSMIFDANQSGSSVLTGSTEQQLSAINATLSDGLYTIAKNTGGTYKVLDQWDGDGQPDIRELSSDYY